MRVRSGLLLFLMVGAIGLYAQSISSTYTSSGIGEMASQGLQQNYSMGGLGYAVPHNFYVNTKNPSLLPYNGFSSFAVGIMGDFRNYQTESQEERINALSLRYLAISFPLIRARWSNAISLLPYSSVDYNSYTIDSLDNDTRALTQYQGNGGLSSLSWSHGIRLYKALSIGLRGAFVFGRINKVSRTQLIGEDLLNAYVISSEENTAYKDLNLGLSFSNKFKLGKGNYLNIGGVYNFSSNLDGERERRYDRYSPAGSVLQSRDLSTANTTYSVPRSIGFGFTYERSNKLVLGSDIEFQQWGNGAGAEGDDQLLENTLSISAGGEFIPDIQNVNNYLKRSTFRFGFQYKELPYRVEGTQINDFGINFGVSLPVSGYSSIEAAFKYGVRGTTDTGNSLVKESYIQAVIGATINDRWFIKRRYD